jgi:hypothetical protein
MRQRASTPHQPRPLYWLLRAPVHKLAVCISAVFLFSPFSLVKYMELLAKLSPTVSVFVGLHENALRTGQKRVGASHPAMLFCPQEDSGSVSSQIKMGSPPHLVNPPACYQGKDERRKNFSTMGGEAVVHIETKLGDIEDAETKEVKLSPPIHLPFQAFQSVDLAFRLTLTPRLCWLHGLSAEQIDRLPLPLSSALTTNCTLSQAREKRSCPLW